MINTNTTTSHFGHQHQNVADVQSKSGAQFTVVNLIGLLFSIRFTEFATKDPVRTWSIYLFLTVLHMHANISMMKILSLNTLNIDRFTIITKKIGNNITHIKKTRIYINSYVLVDSSKLLKEALSNSKIDDNSIRQEIESFITESPSLSLSSIAKVDNLFPFDLSYYLHQLRKKVIHN